MRFSSNNQALAAPSPGIRTALRIGTRRIGIRAFTVSTSRFSSIPPLLATPLGCAGFAIGRIDIKARVAANGGSEQLPDAVPLVCEAGDVTIVNRQMLHGSFANSSPDLRISLTFGFHRRQSVLGAKAALAMEDDNVIYDEQRVFERSAVVQVAIDARYQDRPDEPRFDYKPFSHLQDDFRFNDETFEQVIKNYHTKDLAI